VGRGIGSFDDRNNAPLDRKAARALMNGAVL
jgi:hypothetical protein